MRALLISSVLPWPLHRNGGAQRTALLLRALGEIGVAADVLGVLHADAGGRPLGGGAMPPKPESGEGPPLLAASCGPLTRYVGSHLVTPGVDEAEGGSLWCRLPGPVGQRLRRARRMRSVWHGRYEPRQLIAQDIARRLAEDNYDAVICRYLATGMLAGLDKLPVAPPLLVDLDDVDWLTLRNRFEAERWPGIGGRLGMAWVCRYVERRCQEGLRAYAGGWVASREDAEMVERSRGASGLPGVLRPAEAGVGSVGSVDGDGSGSAPGGVERGHWRVLANIPFSEHGDWSEVLAPLPPTPAEREQVVLFVGDLRHPPNATGLERFLGGIWPRVRAEAPGARFRIVGRGLNDQHRERWSRQEGVEVVGFVEDLRREYEGCALTVAPIWWGGGTKIKVVESAALGRACVATAHAVRGYRHLAEGEGPAMVIEPDADEPREDAEFAGAIVRLLHDTCRRSRMAAAGIHLARQHFGFATVVKAVEGVWERCVAVRGTSALSR